MANKIQLPTRGQPVDTSFLYKLADAINKVGEAVDTRKGKSYIKARTTDAAQSGSSTANTSIFASVFAVVPAAATVDATTAPVTVPIDFKGIAFQAMPVVSVTPITIGDGAEVNKTAYVTITDLTASQCTAHVKFTGTGSVKNLYLHVIAVGTPV
jgi:hypothetical protein